MDTTSQTPQQPIDQPVQNQPNPPVSQPLPTNPILNDPPHKSKFVFVLIAIIFVAGISTVLFLSYKNQVPKTVTYAPPSQNTQPQPLTLTLESPNDGTVVTDNKLVVQGKTLPNTSVVFYTENDQNSTDSDSSGNFQGTITLVNGINTLTVTAYGENGEEKNVTLTLVYDASQK